MWRSVSVSVDRRRATRARARADSAQNSLIARPADPHRERLGPQPRAVAAPGTAARS